MRPHFRLSVGQTPLRELRTLRAFFNWRAAPRRLWIPENPAAEIPMLREGRGAAARVLTDTELAALFTAIAETRLEGPVLFAVNHGLRESEVIHIRQEAVDLSRGTIWIRHDPSTGWYVKGGVERVVRLNEVTSRWLARHLAEPVQDLCLYLFSLGAGKP